MQMMCGGNQNLKWYNDKCVIMLTQWSLERHGVDLLLPIRWVEIKINIRRKMER
jgi:hypothetical protein